MEDHTRRSLLLCSREPNMFYNTDTSRKLQRSSELGLYRYNDSDSDPYNHSTCRYVIVLLITIIIVSLMCLITYNYVAEPNLGISQTAIIRNNESNTEIERSDVQVANMSYSREIIGEPMDESVTEIDTSDDDTNNEPIALELRHDVGNNQRRVIKTPPRPFIYENRDPIPIGFITPAGQINNHENPQTRGRNKAKNIQEIIKYLTDHQTINESVGTGDSTRKRGKKRQRGNDSKSSKKAKGTSNIFTYTADPFFPYKPQNPSDVNLLATNGFRFAPTVQIEPKKPKKTSKQSEIANNVPHRLADNVPVNVNFDSYPAGNERKVRKRKNRYPRPPQYGNYGYGPHNPYNENNFYNQGERQPANRLNYWNRVRNNGREYNRNRIRNDLLHESEVNKPSQIMVHLNLYPKKKRQNGENRNIELLDEEFHSHNCTDSSLEEPSDLAQIKNATEFNQLMQNIKFSYVNHKEESEGENEQVLPNNNNNNNSDDLFQIKDTILKLNEPDEFQHVSNKNHNPEHVEVLKSIGFTVLNPNFTTPDSNAEQYAHNQDHWYPMRVNNGGFLNDQLADMSSNTDHVINNNHRPELNINYDTTDEFTGETVTLPLPRDIFEKYFNKKPPLRGNIDWDDEMLVDNPNLVNHKSHFSDVS